MFGNNVVYRSPTRHLRVQGLGEVNVTSASQTLESFWSIQRTHVTQQKKNNVILLKQELKKLFDSFG